MCGILGIIARDPAKLSGAGAALDYLRHRGPDDMGFWSESGCALGHTRLSILELSSLGHQPMELVEHGLVIVFNGEIYNHLQIRTELEQKGHRFRSSSDTETLLHAYVEYGQDMLSRLNGIFAFAIFDRTRNELFVARDHFGVKPLYYHHSDGLFVCASELKAIAALNVSSLELDREAIASYLYYLWCPGEKTPFRAVKKLLPGFCLTISGNNVDAARPRRYYTLPFGGNRLKAPDDKAWIDALDQHLTAAVKRQLLSDVPVGFFLSGGLDSSLLVAIARKIRPTERIRTFTIEGLGGNSEGFSDDLPYARRVAAHLNVELEVVKAQPAIVSSFDEMVWHLDEPQADAAPINVLNICRRAREMDVKVLIGGAAADDLFSGYRRHQALEYETLFRMLPRGVSRFCSRIAEMMSASKPRVRRMRKLLRDADKSQLERMVGYFGWIDSESLMGLFSTSWRDSLRHFEPGSYLKQRLQEIPGETSPLNQMLFCEMVGFLPDHNLNYTDKLGMAVGVEIRVPYLDRDVVDFACRLPPSLKMKRGMTKYLLRKVAERYLPADIIYRPKTGFGAPVRDWITGDLHSMVQTRLAPERLRKRGIFDPEAVWKLIEKNRRGEIDASYIVWSMLAIESWMDQFIDSPKKAVA